MMKKLSFLAFLMIGFLNSCNSNTKFKKPDQLIDKKTMQNIMVEIYMANSAAAIQNKHKQSNINYAKNIYDKFQIDSIQFNESLYYYTTKVSQHEEILKSVNEILKTKLDSLKILETEYLDKINSVEEDIPSKGLNFSEKD